MEFSGLYNWPLRSIQYSQGEIMFMPSRKSLLRVATLFALAAFSATPVLACLGCGHTPAEDFQRGFKHPFTNADHFMAMLTVGLWIAQAKDKSQYLLVLIFPVMMVLGIWLGMGDYFSPAMERGVAASVAVLGFFVAIVMRLPLWVSAVMVSAFAYLHGYVHGTEMSKGLGAQYDMLGAFGGTLVLHLIGFGLGKALFMLYEGRVVRTAGAGIATYGLFLLAGMS
jgi:urease accessory protein